jgi:hypothetical protein
MAGRKTAVPPSGYVSKTRPRLTSSQDNQVFQGVLPPAQFWWVPDSIRDAPTIAPAELTSELET